MEILVGLVVLVVINIVWAMMKAGARTGYEILTEPADALKKTERDADRVAAHFQMSRNEARRYKNTQVFGTCFTRFALLVAFADNKIGEQEIEAIFRFFTGAAPSYIKGIQDSLAKDLRNPQSIDWEHNMNAAIYLFADPEFSDYESILFDGLLSISAADGRIHHHEISVVAGIMRRLGWAQQRIDDFLTDRFESATKKSLQKKRSAALRTLGLDEGASVDAIKSAFRRLAKQHHPDVVAHMGANFQRSADARFRTLKEAFDILLPKQAAGSV